MTSVNERVMRPSRYPMLAVEEALESVLANINPLKVEEIALSEGLNRVLAENIYSTLNIPSYDTTAMDGYALIAADGQAARRVVGEQVAGKCCELAVTPGTAVRIMSGAILPPGADTVVMVEDTTEEAGVLLLSKPIKPGANIRPTGLDLKAGALVLAAGTLLQSTELALLATINCYRLPVYKKPRIALITVGSELVEPGQPLEPGQLYDSNRYGLLASLAKAQVEPVFLGIARADETALRHLITTALTEYDGLITSGGVSVGKTDLVKAILQELGTIHFGRVNFKPGKQFTFATAEVQGRKKPIFGLPGFPVAGQVTYEYFVRPALLKMAGQHNFFRPVVKAKLAQPVAHDSSRVELVRAILTPQLDPTTGNYTYIANTTGAQQSSRLLSLLGANALLRIEPSPETLPAGTLVDALVLGGE